MADYYNTVPDGVIDDRFGVKHSDFTSPEYKKVDEIQNDQVGRVPGAGALLWLQPRRGRGRDHCSGCIDLSAGGYRQQERQSAVGCRPGGGRNHPAGADGTACARWAHGCTRMEKPSTVRSRGRGQPARAKKASVYALPGKTAISMPSCWARLSSPRLRCWECKAKPGTALHLLGHANPLKWSADGENLKVELPHLFPGNMPMCCGSSASSHGQTRGK